MDNAIQQKPSALAVKDNEIPEELKGLARWVCWIHKPKKNGWTKPPVGCKTGCQINPTDAKNLVAFQEALENYRVNRLAGIGFVFFQKDGFAGIDLDKCREPETGIIDPWALEIIRQFDSYTEVSPSGTGLKIFVRGTLPPGRRKNDKIEMYNDGRYFTVTGHALDYVSAIVEHRQQELNQLHQQINDTKKQKASAAKPAQPRPQKAPLDYAQSTLTDAQIVAMAANLADSKLAKLWAGNPADYPSDSEADLALCGILARLTNGDPNRIEHLFSQSALGEREKWVEREDYRLDTINKAIDSLRMMLAKNNKRIQDIQEKTGENKELQDDTGLNTRRENCEGVINKNLPPALRSQSIEAAVSLAQTITEPDPWQTPFALARRLRCFSEDHPEQFTEAVRAFAEKVGMHFEEVWYGFLTCWKLVRLPEGEDPLLLATQRAEAHPFELADSPGDHYTRVASLAFHLSLLMAPRPFWLPVENIAAWLEISAMTVSRILVLLKKNGIIKCVNPNYSYKGKKCKEYVFTAGAPDS
jgi:hypothetical protein